MMKDWLKEGLSKLLDFEVPDDMIGYILNTGAESELHENMRTLLDFENPQHKNFYNEIVKRKYPNKVMSKQQKKKIQKNKVQQEPVSVEPPPLEADKTKKKSKFVNLYSQDGEKAQVVFLKGRHWCDCEASKHELINNCLSCGRVVCKQEGSGPCMFCGALVCTEDEEKQINSNTKGGAKLLDSLMKNRGVGWEKAVALRDRLIDYDQNSEQRTRVIDDDSDYFQLDSVWLTPKEREQLKKYKKEIQDKKHVSKLNRKVNFDFAGRQIVEEKLDSHVDEGKIREIMGKMSGRRDEGALPTPQDWVRAGDGTAAGFDVAPGFNASLLKYDESVGGHSYAEVAKEVRSQMSKIQDSDLQLMGDAGRCLSMHQPWASLLVEGIKRHEGRTWYTSHRGRLWIASTAKPPDQDLVKAIEDQYRALYPDKTIQFPTFYPPGCLLGCVTVEDCLPQEEYQKLYEGREESDSPYVWICSNPVSLKLRFPVKGQHKIYNLDKTIHNAALKYIHNVAKMQPANDNPKASDEEYNNSQ